MGVPSSSQRREGRVRLPPFPRPLPRLASGLGILSSPIAGSPLAAALSVDPPALFFAVLAFLVCFGWFTLLYFVSSLWSEGNGQELCVSNSTDHASIAGEPRGEEEREQRAVKRVAEHAGDSVMSEVCVASQEIKEVFEDGFSEETQHITRMASPGICVNNKEHAHEEEIVKEVMMFETDKMELKAFVELDCSSEKHKQLRETPIDCFVEELNTIEFGTKLTSAKLLDVPYDVEFIGNNVEMSVFGSLEILEFIDKHDTAEIAVDGSDFETADVPSSDDSIHHGIGKEHRKEIEQERTEELSVNGAFNRLPECILDEWREAQNLVIVHNNKFSEDGSIEEDGEQAVGISDEAHDSLCNPTVLPLDSVCQKDSETVAVSSTPFHQDTTDQDGELEEELSKNKRVESSTSASAVRDFAENHWRIIEQLDSFGNEESIHQEDSPETLALETAEDEDRDDNYCTSTGASRRLPLIRRSPAQWWNLCGVLDAFSGGEE